MTPLSPKQRLHANDAARKAVEQLMTPDLAAAVEIAFAEFCYELPGAGSPPQAWDANCRRDGAKKFIETLLTLGDKAAPARAPMGSGTLLPDSREPSMVFQPPKT